MTGELWEEIIYGEDTVCENANKNTGQHNQNQYPQPMDNMEKPNKKDETLDQCYDRWPIWSAKNKW